MATRFGRRGFKAVGENLCGGELPLAYEEQNVILFPQSSSRPYRRYALEEEC